MKRSLLSYTLMKDKDTLGLQVKEGLEKAKYFEVVSSLDGMPIDEKTLLSQSPGRYQMGVVIREGSTAAIRHGSETRAADLDEFRRIIA